MTAIYFSPEGERVVRERYREVLTRWPVPSQQLTVPTREGETFVVACGPGDAPPLVLLHGAGTNSAMWMGDVADWSGHFRVYAVDVIGEPGLSAPSRPPLGSEAYALWLDDVLAGLGIGADDRVSLAGASLGGWMAVDYATRRPGRVERLALLCPGGIGAQKRGFLFKALALMMLGRWGRRRALELAMGATPGAEGPDDEAFMAFAILTFTHFRPRRKPLPVFGDDALRGLTMPTLVIVGGRDVMLDSADTRRRVEATMPHARVVFLPETGHGLRAQTARILSFLLDPAPAGPPGTPAG